MYILPLLQAKTTANHQACQAGLWQASSSESYSSWLSSPSPSSSCGAAASRCHYGDRVGRHLWPPAVAALKTRCTATLSQKQGRQNQKRRLMPAFRSASRAQSPSLERVLMHHFWLTCLACWVWTELMFLMLFLAFSVFMVQNNKALSFCALARAVEDRFNVMITCAIWFTRVNNYWIIYMLKYIRFNCVVRVASLNTCVWKFPSNVWIQLVPSAWCSIRDRANTRAHWYLLEWQCYKKNYECEHLRLIYFSLFCISESPEQWPFKFCLWPSAETLILFRLNK